MRAFIRSVSLVVVLHCTTQPNAQGTDDQPRLVIDTQGHSGIVREMIFTPDGTQLVTMGYDKTIRVWDVESGDLRRTMRGQIGNGAFGNLYAGAMTKDGEWLLVAGVAESGNTGVIRLIHFPSGRIAAVLEGHDLAVVDLVISNDGKWAASASYDDTAKVWDISGATAKSYNGEPAIRIQPTQTLEPEGEAVKSVSFSPDGNRLVTGQANGKLHLWERADVSSDFKIKADLDRHTAGVLCGVFSPDGTKIATGGSDEKLYLWDGLSGEFLKEVDDDMDYSVAVVEFSPDGKRLLASSQYKGRGKIAIYSIPEGEGEFRFSKHNNSVRATAWNPVKNLIATSGGDDVDTYLWHPADDLEKGVEAGEVKHHLVGQGRSMWAVGFSKPNHLKVAFGQNNDPKLNLKDERLEKIFDFVNYELITPEKVDSSSFRKTTLSASGHTLSISDDRLHLEVGNLGNIENDRVWDGGIRCATFTPDGRKIVVASDHSLKVYSNSDQGFKELAALKGHNNTVWAVSPSWDGRYLASAGYDQTVRLWNLADTDPKKIPVMGALLKENENGLPEINRCSESGPAEAAGFFAGDVILQANGMDHRDQETLVDYIRTRSPGERVLFLISRQGKKMEKSLTLGEMEVGKQTISPLATLFVARDGEWVCWTPGGQYHASPGGEQYIGWHFNRGIDRMSEYFPSYVFRDQFHEPELVKRTIFLGSSEKAKAELGRSNIEIAEVLPPRIDWIFPTQSEVGRPGEKITVRARISSPNAELEEIKLLLNGKAIESEYTISGHQFLFEKDITLLPGENRFSVFARNKNTGHTSEERSVLANAPTHLVDEASETELLSSLLKPNLYVLSVGVSKYKDTSIPGLKFCDDDASAIASFFREQKDGIFGDTEVKLLTDEEATEDGIQEALDWLEDNATQKDFVVLFLAAHGVNDEKGQFYLLPHDANPDRLRSTGVAWDDFGDVLGNLPSRVLMFLDTCHSGRLGANLFSLANNNPGTRTRSVGGLRSAFDPSEAIRELTSEEYGVVIMAASTGDEGSVESDQWGHGAFTLGLLEGMRGGADVNNDDVVHLRELDFFVSDRIKELTKGAQHPTTVKPSTISRLPVAAVR